MAITDIQLTSQEWQNFWRYFKGEPQQQEAVEMLRQYINEADPTLLTQNATWIQKYRSQPLVTERFTPDKPFSYKITPHITYGEIALQSEARRFTQQQQCETCTMLCEFLEKARSAFGGKPLIITSGYRPPAVNASVGGSSTSEHLYDMQGKGAVDFTIDGVNVFQLQDWCDANWDHSLGYGAKKGFVHLGIRPNGGRIRWDY